MSYDIIGDIHGCARTLQALLAKLGYTKSTDVYRHPSRKVIFLGDFIDRGPLQREVIDIVRPMINKKAALSVMGNHEFNAIAYYTRDDNNGGYLRPHSEKNKHQHKEFLEAFNGKSDYGDVINWFKQLPMWLELDGLKVVHACWDQTKIDRLGTRYPEAPELSDRILTAASRPGTWEYDAVETLLKGKEIPLPAGSSFTDTDGTERHHIRIKWWDGKATNYTDAFMGPESARSNIPNDTIKGDHLIVYAHAEPPVFLGHYWLEGEPKPLASNIACVDYSVAKAGKLVAYRWDGEQTLSSSKFVGVERIEALKT